MNLPDAINDDLIEILGHPNFACGAIARRMRADGATIPPKSEVEQAHVLFKLMGIYAEHGAFWRNHAAVWIDEMSERVKARTA